MTRRPIVSCLLLGVATGCSVDIGAPNKVPRISVVSDISRTDTIDAEPTKPIVIAISDSTGRLRNEVTVTISGVPVPGGDVGMLVIDQNGGANGSTTLVSSGQASFKVIFGRRAGQRPIIITVPEIKLVDTLWFTVKPGAPAYVTLRPAQAAVVVGGTYQQSATVIDRGGNDPSPAPSLTFSSVNPSVTVSAAGVVTGVAYGLADVKVTSGILNETAIVSVVPTGRLATILTPPGVTDLAITVLGTDGSGPRRYPAPQDPSAAAWSPDATTIYYVGTSRVANPTQRIYSLAMSDGAVSPLISDTVSALSGAKLISPAVSFDGTWIYFATQIAQNGPTSGEIWRVHPDGAGAERLVSGAVAGSPYVVRASPSPSPDGTRVAYIEKTTSPTTTANDIKILDLQSGNTLTISGSGADEVRWSPTGDRIATKGGAGLYVVNADGSGLTQLIQNVDFFTGLDWSPDGRWILANIYGVATILEPTTTGLRLPLNLRGVVDSWSPR
ncbi:MAG: TolB protein [Gemmatimonadaceae bacterium]|nr:TolB protein [Gemmatimonadaceae bacterium]